jgi:hypothetical protein
VCVDAAVLSQRVFGNDAYWNSPRVANALTTEPSKTLDSNLNGAATPSASQATYSGKPNATSLSVMSPPMCKSIVVSGSFIINLQTSSAEWGARSQNRVMGMREKTNDENSMPLSLQALVDG